MTRHGIITDQPCHREDVTLEQTHSHTLKDDFYKVIVILWVVRLYVDYFNIKRGIAILYHLHQCRPSCLSW